jgi:hypothetical protein
MLQVVWVGLVGFGRGQGCICNPNPETRVLASWCNLSESKKGLARGLTLLPPMNVYISTINPQEKESGTCPAI